jgi:thiosulfate dehydrogenase [quinone] large subunit
MFSEKYTLKDRSGIKELDRVGPYLVITNKWLYEIGEFVVGVVLILGLFVGIAVFAGGFMNWNYIMAGTASTNPLLFVAAILPVLAWKTAGYYGLDRFLLPRLGAPWGHRADNPALADRVPAAVG